MIRSAVRMAFALALLVVPLQSALAQPIMWWEILAAPQLTQFVKIGNPPHYFGAYPEGAVSEIAVSETLWSIAQKYKTTVSEICKLNNIPLMKLLIPGDRIKVASSG